VQYMIAIPLLFGRLTAADYEDGMALDPVWGKRIDFVRDLIDCEEEPCFTRDYYDPEKRSIANALRVELTDGTVLEETVEYPIGHRRRRSEGIPLLLAKFEKNLRTRLAPQSVDRVLSACREQARLEQMPVHEFTSLFGP